MNCWKHYLFVHSVRVVWTPRNDENLYQGLPKDPTQRSAVPSLPADTMENAADYCDLLNFTLTASFSFTHLKVHLTYCTSRWQWLHFNTWCWDTVHHCFVNWPSRLWSVGDYRHDGIITHPSVCHHCGLCHSSP